jgi:hypothetical protein
MKSRFGGTLSKSESVLDRAPEQATKIRGEIRVTTFIRGRGALRWRRMTKLFNVRGKVSSMSLCGMFKGT